MNEKKNTQVVSRDDGGLVLVDPESICSARIVLYPDEVKALRTYFQEERDTELNRWRDPLNPVLVCLPITEHSIHVLNERDGLGYTYGRGNGVDLQSSNPYVRAARRYFEAHPPKKPWEKAAQGDIWILTSHGGEVAPYTKIGEKWSREHVIDTYTDDYFIDGYRFWSKLQIESWEGVKKNRAMKTGLILFVDTKKEIV